MARLQPKKGREKALRELLVGIVDPTRKERGCIRYELLQGREGDFVFVEEWESDAAIDAHMKTPHITAALARVGELVEGAPDIRRYELVR